MPDRTTYKQYSIGYNMDKLKVQVEVPDEMVLQKPDPKDDSGFYVLTPDGMAYVANVLASAVETVHSKWLKGSATK